MQFRFGYVEFPDADAAKDALDTLTGSEMDGRELRVDIAAPKQSGGGGGGGGGRSFGGGRGGSSRGGRGMGYLFILHLEAILTAISTRRWR